MLTKEQKDKWLVRLRDPNSKQLQWGYANNALTRDVIKHNPPLCCLAHGQYAISGELHCEHTKFDIFHAVEKQVGTLIRLNDEDKLSLPQIADWIEANVSTKD